MPIDKNMQCRICNHSTMLVMRETILKRHEISYYDCPQCGFVQTEHPFWLEDAYASSINISDTGILQRNVHNKNIVLSLLVYMGFLKAKILDFAGGYGILTRLLRDAGINAFWNDKYTANLFARGFEYTSEDIGLVTAFEVAEHLVYPLKEFKEMQKLASSILVSTEIIDDVIPASKCWWYYGLDHGQHIGFFRVKTLKYIASELKCNFYTDERSYHLFTSKKLSNKTFKIFIRLNKFFKLIPEIIYKPLTIDDHFYLSKK